MKNITTLALIACALITAPLFAVAADTVTAGVNTSVAAPTVKAEGSATAGAAQSIALMRGKDRAHQEIDRRVTNLNGLIARVQAMLNLSSTDKTAIAGTLGAQITALNALKAKIDADADVTTLKGDVDSVTSSYRIYALVMPQGAIIAAADRIVTVAAKLHLIGVKFETRIVAAAAAGNDVTAVRVVLDEYNAKIADASLQAQAAVNAIVALVPDEGDATKKAANTKALKDARAQIVLAHKDLQTARNDANKILTALKSMKVSATATTTTSGGIGQ